MTPHKEILRFYTAILIWDGARGATGIAIWPAQTLPTYVLYVVSAALNDSLICKENSRGQKVVRIAMPKNGLMTPTSKAVAQPEGE